MPGEGGSAGDSMTGGAGEGPTPGGGGEAGSAAGAGGGGAGGEGGAPVDDGGEGGAPVDGSAGAGGDGGEGEPTLEELVTQICAKEPGGEACDHADCEDDFLATYTFDGSCAEIPETRALLACYAATDDDAFTCEDDTLTTPSPEDACSDELDAWAAALEGCAG